MTSGKTIFSFIAGAAIGSAVTWKLVKTKYEIIAQQEIDSVKEVFFRREEAIKPPEPEEPTEEISDIVRAAINKARNKEDINRYISTINTHDYASYSNKKKDEEVEEVEEEDKENEEAFYDKPTVIDPRSFGEIEYYACISLNYFTDKVLADEDNEPIKNIDEVVGYKALGSFGEYEDDAVYVRNDELKSYFEILLDNRRYADVRKTIPHQEED